MSAYYPIEHFVIHRLRKAIFDATTQGITVVSRDTREFERARVPVFNPWGDKAA
jgi:hypothetical protein